VIWSTGLLLCPHRANPNSFCSAPATPPCQQRRARLGHYVLVPLDELVLVDPWLDLRGGTPDDEAERERIAGELDTELSPGHVLYGKTFDAVSRCWARDDVLLRLENGKWAVVHLTYGGRESPPFPSTRILDSVQAVERELALRDYGRGRSSDHPAPQ
jgi:hypothetical protein